MPSGFILHPTYYVEKNRPIVHLFGRFEDGTTFVVRDDTTRPHFFLRTADIPAALRVAAFTHEETDWTDPNGEPLSAVYVVIPPDAPRLRDPLQAQGLRTYEADIPFATRFLMDRALRGSVRVEGDARRGRLVDWIYVNPTLTPASTSPRLSVLSLDIETDPAAGRLLSVALVGCGASEVLLVDPGNAGNLAGKVESGAVSGSGTPETRVFPTQRAALEALHARVRALDPDVLTGWNVIDFDLQVLQDLFTHERLPFTLGRADIPARVRQDRSAWGASRAIVPGRVVLDGLGLLRDAFYRLEDYRLETAAQEILGKGKLVVDEDGAGDRGAEILGIWRSDPLRLADYNRRDAELVLEILEARDLLTLAVRRSQITGMPLDRVSASIAAFDFLYLSELHARRVAMPTTDPDREQVPTAGGWVFDSVPGLFTNVGVFDFKSLYPSLIRTFRLDPLSVVPSPDTEETESALLQAPNGAWFRRRGGILPDLLDRLFPMREAALEDGDPPRAQALKIQMNSFYGVLATTRCRFYSPETANAITGFGQSMLRRTRALIEAKGLSVLYGDTDSLFVDLGEPDDPDAAETRGRVLAGEINEALTSALRAEYDVESRLFLKFEKLFHQLMLPALRHSTQGSKKRYVGLIRNDGREHLDFVGLESVRRDWTELAKTFQHDLVWRVFRKEPVDAMIRGVLVDLRAGRLDDRLIYRKALRKDSEAYTRTTPPHVQAARRMSGKPGRVIEYVMTDQGAEPARERKGRLDYEHYIEKQLRPVAESILALLGRDWDAVASNQGTLF